MHDRPSGVDDSCAADTSDAATPDNRVSDRRPSYTRAVGPWHPCAGPAGRRSAAADAADAEQGEDTEPDECGGRTEQLRGGVRHWISKEAREEKEGQ
ncbi:hypothetical protein GCM10010145_11080 [Streptomyces ruber]|uniref:Uncharacterized protein n=2 Tax=Streptomyces TaxID=1883 RepID=A0A918B866_9ACTN|nr:hypothetical protein GCM10010145_11080 [Streptomyces ruber]